MKSVPLNAFARSQSGRPEVKKLRDAGRIPATIYGRQTKPENLELVWREMTDLINHSLSENILVDLDVNEKKRLALVQEVQHHPLTGKVLHIDFHEVAEDELVTVMVPVETTGEAVGVKTGGGVLEHIIFKLKVRALPKNLPEQILIDVTELAVGKSIHLGEVKAPDGVEIMGKKSTTVVAVAMPKVEVEVAPVEGAVAAAGDVEMTKEKKDDGTAAPAAKAGDKAAAGKTDAKAAPAKDAKAAPAGKK